MSRLRLLSVVGPIVSVLAGPAAAHDFWLQPRDFNLAPGATTPLTIQVGHGPARQAWAVATERVVRLDSVGPDGRVDRRGDLRPTKGEDVATLSFHKPGTYVLAFQTNPALSDLPSIRYNDYAKFEGLTPALRERERTHKTDQPGRELYSRRAKALIQVGPIGGPDAAVTRPLGLTLEIVPEHDPYTLKPGDPLPVYVLYQGRRLPGALVKLTSLEFDARPVEMHLSDTQGRASFRVPHNGEWLINVIWTQPIHGDPRADFETVFSSLTFGYPAHR